MKIIIYISSIFLLFAFDVMSQTTIKIDGSFDDWNANLNTYIDADNNACAGDSTNNIGSEYVIDCFNRLIVDDTDANPNNVDTLSLYDDGTIEKRYVS